MRKEKHSGSVSKQRDKKEKATSVTRALSWLSGSSLSRRTRKLFRSHSDLNSISHRDQEKGGDDDDDWVYEPQHYIGEGIVVYVSVCLSVLYDWIARWSTFISLIPGCGGFSL